MAELAALKKQRKNNKIKLTNIIKFANGSDLDTPLEQLNVRLNRVEKLMVEFTEIENSILQLDEEDPGDPAYEENYYNAIAGLNIKIRDKNLSIGNGVINLDTSNNATQFGSRSEVKLPKIHIPSFSGEYSEWQSFYDLYTATIHEAPSLNAVQKFQYLKGLLRGEAAILLRHINVTESNYIGALNKLKERYDRKKHIINSFIRTFVEQPPIHTSNAAQIKRLMDTSDEVIRGLKALGDIAESRDHWLIYLLVNKLDDKSKALWAETVADIENPDFPLFLKFLARRIDTLESMAISSKRATYKPEIKGHIAINKSIAVDPPTANKSIQFQCAMCQNKNHSLFQCNDFHSLDARGRKDFAKRDNRCFNCMSSKHPIFKCPSKRRCQTCGMKHHTLLHQDEEKSETVSSQETKASHHVATSSPGVCLSSVLPTAIIQVTAKSGQLIACRALLDSGSQASFITESFAQKLQLKKRNARISVSGLGQSSAMMSKGLVTIIIKPESSPEFPLDALVLSKITSKLPQQELDISEITSLQGIKLADPHFYKKSDIDILIGADYFFNVLKNGQIRNKPDEPNLQNTIFGWIVSGRIREMSCNHTTLMLAATNPKQEMIDIDKTLRRFWELDSIDNPKTILSEEETYCEEHFKHNLQRNTEGRFIVRLPFKSSPSNFSYSLSAAIQRLRAMERRFQRNPEFKTLYHNFLTEYQELKHMTEIPSEEINDNGFYLPHHGVLKPTSSTSKLRVVFDGSARTGNGNSLNDCLAVGPTVQSTLFAILLRFREHKFVFSADVQKMYRQVMMSPEDRQFQKIIWRSDPSKPIRHFKLNTVTYGLGPSSFLATRAIKQIAEDNKSAIPLATNAISNDMYVDDLMTGADNTSELMQLQEQITTALSNYGFQLRKWKSNSHQIMDKITSENNEDHLKQVQDQLYETSNSTKVLGIIWNSKTDNFIFTSDLPEVTKFTKRTVLSEASRIFDPLGWLSPVVIRTKIFLQLLWTDKLEWDDPLPAKKILAWHKIRHELKYINLISIPRFIQSERAVKVDIHGFCDASQLAYAAVIYFKVIKPNGDVFINMVTAKTKVAPIKQQTLPRLELCAAVLLNNLIKIVIKETQCSIRDIFAWTDSKIVLDWLSSHPKRWSTFVGNRTSEILCSLPRKHWWHVPSQENAADCATRGLSPLALQSHRLWWNGPEWLHNSSEFWPDQIINPSNLEEKREMISFQISIKSHNEWYNKTIHKYSSFRKLHRVMSYIYRFIGNIKRPKGSRIDGIYLRRTELFNVLHILCQNEQRIFYHEDILSLQRNGEVSKESSLKSLNPYIEQSGLMRVGGRLENSLTPHSTKHPIILPSNSQITKLIFHDVHLDNKHAGPSLLLAISRQEFWVPNGKSKAKETVGRCVICTKFKAQCQQQLMGNLPRSRVEYIRPFLKTGVDYAGPIAIHLMKGRGQKTYKSYICLFICLSTKAVHLELVNDLSSDSFLGALKRFTARRGICEELHSDNGTNFVGADAKLRAEFTKLINHSNNISDFFCRNRIEWHFIPPNSPHFGGIWEAAIKSTKFHLKRVIGKHIFTLEEMHTLLAEIEGILNSRPLCRLTNSDVDFLTPSHFLLGHPTTKIPEIDITEQKMSHLSRWQMVQQISQQFWKRWYIEYLTSLQQRSKWRLEKDPVKVNDIVAVKDNNMPVNQWLLGRVIQVHPGSDGIVRVATIKTQNGEFQRPIHKLCILPISNEVVDDTINKVQSV